MQSSIIMPMVCAKTKAEKIAIQNAATAEWVSLIQCGHPSGVKSTCKYEKNMEFPKAKQKNNMMAKRMGVITEIVIQILFQMSLQPPLDWRLNMGTL